MSFRSFIVEHKNLFIISSIFFILFRLTFFQLPLFRNFDIEIAILYSFIYSIYSGFVSIYFLQKKVKINYVISFLMILVIMTFLIFSLIDLIFNQCPVDEGFLFYPLFVSTSSIFFSTIGMIFSNARKTIAYSLLLLVYLILIIYGILDYYYSPQLFLFNPLIVFFPGLVYNEIFEVEARFLIYSAGLLSFAFLMIIANILHERLISKRLITIIRILSFVPLILLYIFSDRLDLSASEAKLNSKFHPLERNDRYKIYTEDKNISEIDKIIYISTVDFHYSNLVNETGVNTKKIHLYIFESNDSKRKLLGEESADFTKPWQRRIFVTRNSFHQTIKHELAHIFLGEFSGNIFKVAGNLNLGLIEGGAMALEWEWLENTPEYYAAMILKFIGDFNANDFFQNYSFATGQSYINYLISGAFCRHLINKYGFTKFSEFYRTGDFEKIYNKNINEEFEKFKNELKRYDLTIIDSIKANFFFRSRTIFEKKCPRSYARIKKKAQEFFNSRNFVDAKNLFLKVYDQTHDPESFYYVLRIKFNQQRFEELIKFFEQSSFQNKLLGITALRSHFLYILALAMTNREEKAKVEAEKLKSIILSSNWSHYISLIEFLIKRQELILELSKTNFNDFIEKIAKVYNDNLIVLSNNIENLNINQLELIVQYHSHDFWLMNRCFFRFIYLGNFEKANSLIKKLESSNRSFNEAELYRLRFMKHVLNEIMEKGI